MEWFPNMLRVEVNAYFIVFLLKYQLLSFHRKQLEKFCHVPLEKRKPNVSCLENHSLLILGFKFGVQALFLHCFTFYVVFHVTFNVRLLYHRYLLQQYYKNPRVGLV